MRQIWNTQEAEKRGIRYKFTWKDTAGIRDRAGKVLQVQSTEEREVVLGACGYGWWREEDEAYEGLDALDEGPCIQG